MKRRDTRSGSASSLCEDPCRRSCARSPWDVLSKSCCARSLCKAIYKSYPSKTSAPFTRSLYKISIRGPLGRSVYKISVRALSVQISWRGFLAKPLGKISVRDLSAILFMTSLCNKALCNVSVQGLHNRCLGKIFASKSSVGKISKRSLQTAAQKIGTSSRSTCFFFPIATSVDGDGWMSKRNVNRLAIWKNLTTLYVHMYILGQWPMVTLSLWANCASQRLVACEGRLGHCTARPSRESPVGQCLALQTIVVRRHENR